MRKSDWFLWLNRWNFFDVRVGHWKWLNVWLSVCKRWETEVEYRTEYGQWITMGVALVWFKLVLIFLVTDKDWLRIEVHLRASRRAGA